MSVQAKPEVMTQDGGGSSVILCAYNRCWSLAKALDSVAASTLPESVAWEVLVVARSVV
jgi:hypothetical protein